MASNSNYILNKGVFAVLSYVLDPAEASSAMKQNIWCFVDVKTNTSLLVLLKKFLCQKVEFYEPVSDRIWKCCQFETSNDLDIVLFKWPTKNTCGKVHAYISFWTILPKDYSYLSYLQLSAYRLMKRYQAMKTHWKSSLQEMHPDFIASEN